MIKDKFGRIHNYLRISLTDNCNLRCFYCMPEDDYLFTPHHKLMQAAEIRQIAEVMVGQGVNKIRLTGGEPLVRKDTAAIIRTLAELPVNLTMTTNGIRVDDLLPEIQAAGFKSINVSLDTLRPERFQQITRTSYFARVRRNIDLLLANQIRTKINVVVMKDLNDDEIPDFIALTKEMPVEVRFIEFMPFSGNRWTSNQVFTYHEILARIQNIYPVQAMTPGANDTGKPFAIPGHAGSFAVISTMTAPFCEGCNRMRLTADGKLKNCLFSARETDLLTPLREGQDILPLIHTEMMAKARALGGQLKEDFQQIDAPSLKNRSMISIGG